MRPLLMLWLAAFPTFGGIVTTGTLTDNGVAMKMTHFYEGDSFRMENRKAAATVDDHWTIFRGKTRDIIVADPTKKSYLEIQQDDLERLSSILSGFVRKGTAPTTGPADITFKTLEGLHTTGKWQCRRHDVLAAGKKVGSLCTVPYASVKAKVEDFNPLLAAAKSVSSLSKLGQIKIPVGIEGLKQGLSLGFPVEFVALHPDGKVRANLLIETVSKQVIADNTFLPPKGFQRNDLTSLLKGHLKR